MKIKIYNTKEYFKLLGKELEKEITLDELENSKLRENQPKNSQEELNAPILPQLEEDDNDYDLQKELEAKFDELFGPITDDDE